MRVGDLVRHPQGIVNVSKETYSFGLVLEIEHLDLAPDNRVVQHLVWWCNGCGPMSYLEESLELISESR